MNIVSMVSTRPQFVKASTVSRIIRNTGEASEYLVHTRQHYDRSIFCDLFYSELDIPEPNNKIEVGSATHGAQAGRMLEPIEGLLLEECPIGQLLARR